ncbi:MAG: mevalonate kinase [Rudaea sp.]
MTTASASGKIILFGEHAVVYGRPALAVPLGQVRAHARIVERSSPGVTIHALDLGITFTLDNAPPADPLVAIVSLALEALQPTPPLALELDIWSDLPIAGGLGSGAAISTAIVRALAAHLGKPLGPAQISALVYESEKLYHGTPSGIDNTVIAYEQAIRFDRATGPRPIRIERPFLLAIANTGISSPTRTTVGDVRRGWQNDQERFERLFDQVAQVVERAQSVLESGTAADLGPLMDRNQDLLREIGVSSNEIEKLAAAARAAGAGGAKLSGGGRGGNVIAVVDDERSEQVKEALLAAGAASVILTRVG